MVCYESTYLEKDQGIQETEITKLKSDSSGYVT
jgi:hypothetical protein